MKKIITINDEHEGEVYLGDNGYDMFFDIEKIIFNFTDDSRYIYQQNEYTYNGEPLRIFREFSEELRFIHENEVYAVYLEYGLEEGSDQFGLYAYVWVDGEDEITIRDLEVYYTIKSCQDLIQEGVEWKEHSENQ